MEQERKETIIHEIKYWKENQLIPSHYCDFLLALYTEGTGDIDEASESVLVETKPRDNIVATLLPHLFSLLMISVIPLVLSVLLITNLSSMIQLIIIMGGWILVSLFYFLSQQVKVLKNSYNRALYHISIVLTGLFISGYLSQAFIFRIAVLVASITAGMTLGIRKKDRWLIVASIFMATLGFVGMFV